MIARLAAAALVLVAAACGSSNERSATTARIDECTERFVSQADVQSAEVRAYARTTYCERFDQRGWVYDDGSLKLAAYTKIGTEECEEAEAGGTTGTISCGELGPQILDCALLKHVRRDEVQEYVEEVQQRGDVRCDDGTPLSELGAG